MSRLVRFISILKLSELTNYHPPPRSAQPILVAAAIDYDMITGNRYGDIARRVEDETRDKRWRREQSQATSSSSASNPRPGMPPAYHMLSEEEAEALEINGGTVIIGRGG